METGERHEVSELNESGVNPARHGGGWVDNSAFARLLSPQIHDTRPVANPRVGAASQLQRLRPAQRRGFL